VDGISSSVVFLGKEKGSWQDPQVYVLIVLCTSKIHLASTQRLSDADNITASGRRLYPFPLITRIPDSG
jgi:hypothetical protein